MALAWTPYWPQRGTPSCEPRPARVTRHRPWAAGYLADTHIVERGRDFSRKTPPTRLGAAVAVGKERRRSVEAAALCADFGGSTPPAGSIPSSPSLSSLH